MTALVIADDEDFLKALPVAPADVLISCGDLPDADILMAAERCGCRQIFAVKGNHDSGAPFRKPIVDLHLQTFQFEGITFGGFCGAWRYKPVGHYLFEQDHQHANAETGAEGTRVVGVYGHQFLVIPE